MSILQMGDYDLTETVDIPFHTFDSNDPTESITISDLAPGDIEIHKDGSDTQRASDDGVTVSIDFDGITGNHMLHIDLSDNDDADYYAIGSRYAVRIEGCTVDAGNPVNGWIGVFSIGLVLRPTVAGRTLDVNAAGEAGLDLDNTSGTWAAAQFASNFLTAAKIATNAINADSMAADGSVQIAAAVWDRVLTGVTHNIVNSAGRRLRQIQEAGGYSGGAVWLDTIDGTAGTDPFENGTETNPVDSIIDALTIAASVNLKIVHVLPGSSIQLAAAFENMVMTGDQYEVDLNGQSISGSRINNCRGISGTFVAVAARPSFIFSLLNNVTADPFDCFECGYLGTLTIGTAGTFTLGGSATVLPHGTYAVIDYGAGLDASNITIQSWGGGGIEIQNAGAGAGTYSLSMHGWGELVINANCSDTTVIDLHGSIELTNNSAITTITSETNYAEAGDIAAILADTNELQTDDIPGLIAALNDIAAADVWSEGSARTEAFGLLFERLADWHFNEKTVTDSTGAVVLRNQGDSGDLADWGITDNATLTVSTEVVWV